MLIIILTGLHMIRFIITMFRPFVDAVLEVFHWLFCRKTKPLPPIDNKILLMSATELAQKIRRKELSAVEVMEAYIHRIKQVQPIINACIDNRFEEALADAREVDSMLKTGTKTEEELAETKPLLGVPFSCKEIVGVKNLAQTWGLRRFKDRKAPEDSYAAAQYRKAGAIPVVVTNVPLMSAWWDTSNPVFGTTKNPYNSYRTAGGSSGGESSLISSAGAVIGIGSDLAGSIRIPASFCGVYGHKPTRGLVSNKATWPVMFNSQAIVNNLDPFVATGPMCRYAEDLPLLVKVLSGSNCQKLRLDEKVDFSNVRVYYMEEFPGYLLSATSDVKDSVIKAVKYFREKHGATTRKLEMKELKYAFHIWLCKLFEAKSTFRSLDPDLIGPLKEIREVVKWGFGYSEYNLRSMFHALVEFREKDKFYQKCLDSYNVIERKLAEILDGDAILILPLHPEPPPFSILTIPKFPNLGYTAVFNALGLPVTVVPSGQSGGLPLGLQVVAKKNNDHLTLSAAVELNDFFGGWRSPSPTLV